MAEVTAKQVKELREATGAGMMDSKKALVEADGDFEAAVQKLREKGLAKAASRSDRDSTEGYIAVTGNDEAASLVQLKSETDFAAKSEDFRKFASQLADAVLKEDVDVVSEYKKELEDLQLTIKENISVGTVGKLVADGGRVAFYVHGDGKIGVLLRGEGVEDEVLHEIALHSAFSKPKYLSRDQVPEEDIQKERDAFLEITKAEGKPKEAWDKIVEGRVDSWLAETVLLEQGLFGEKETVSDKLGNGKLTDLIIASVGN